MSLWVKSESRTVVVVGTLNCPTRLSSPLGCCVSSGRTLDKCPCVFCAADPVAVQRPAGPGPLQRGRGRSLL